MHGVPKSPPKQLHCDPTNEIWNTPLHVFGPVKLPLTLYVSVQPPGILPVFEKFPAGHVVAAPDIATGFDGEAITVAPSCWNRKLDTFTLTSPEQQE
jgi:hypothetical protein